MKILCEIVSKNLFPIIRSILAQTLVKKYGLTQIETAKKLGVTQAAVSQYITSKRGAHSVPKDILALILPVTDKLASELINGKISKDEIASKFCEICSLLKKENKFNKIRDLRP
ncbi:MAG: transcriptional regulator [Candidatus Odinarchaeia archaeon]